MMNEQVRDNESYIKAERDKHVVLNVVAADTTISNTVAESTLFSFTVPANTLGSTGSLVLDIDLSTLQNAADPSTTLVFKVKFGGTIVGTYSYGTVYKNPNVVIAHLRHVLKGNGATNAQRGMLVMTGSVGGGFTTPDMSGSGATASIDSTSNQVLLVTVTMGTASANMTTTLRSARLVSMPAG
jgi:hypothetical protein